MTAAVAPAAPKTKQTTEYVVIKDREDTPPTDPPSFTRLGSFKATSANDAIRQAAGDKAGTYRAIPARSFKPVKVTVQTETKITLG